MFNYISRILAVRLSCYHFCQCSISTGQWNLGRKFNQVNPGLDKRLSIIGDTPSKEIKVEDIEDLEADFTNAGRMYTSHKEELEAQKENQKLEIIRRKYFKPHKQPNFLTWAEKEQVRLLHRNDPEEWTAEKLSRSFPAPEMIIKKIIKSQWKPADQNKVKAHDKSVESNWKALDAGKVDIEGKIKTHLLKFATRRRATIAHSITEEVIPLKIADSSAGSKTSSGVFLNIIESYTKGTDKKQELPHVNVKPSANIRSPPKGDTYLLDYKLVQNSNKQFTLDQYRESSDQYINNSISPSLTSVQDFKPYNNSKNSNQAAVNKYVCKEKKPSVKIEKADNFYHYDEHITIPPNKWKGGGIYKVGECYYADDGEFLYRVPGIK